MAEGGELEQELFREVEEETGVQIEELTDEKRPVLVTTKVRYKHGEVWRNNYFLLEMDDLVAPEVLEKFNREEFSEIRFVSVEDVRGLRFAFGDGEIVRSFFKRVGN